MKGAVCFDIGGTGVKYGLITDDGIHLPGYFETDRENGQAVLDAMSLVIERYLKDHEVEGIGISSPGFVDRKTGTVISGNVIEGFNGMNLRQYFLDRFDLPLAIENDANCAAIAEHELGNGRGYSNVAVVTLGTGVGGGLILNDQIYSGNNCMAGEFGFMFIRGIETELPQDSILSAYASTRAMVENANRLTVDNIDGVEVFNRAELGDLDMQQVLDDFYDAIAMGIYNICYTVAPEAVLIGGGVSKQPKLIEEVKKRISGLKPSFSVDLMDVVDLKPCKFFNDAGMLGAYCNLKNLLKETAQA